LLELDDPGLHPLFVKVWALACLWGGADQPNPNPINQNSKRIRSPQAAIAMALDRRDRERELVSRLLAALRPAALADDAVR